MEGIIPHNKKILKKLGITLQVVLLSLGFVLSSAAPALAVAPTNIITYQGRLLNSNAIPVANTTRSMEFRLYTAASGGTCLWSNSHATCNANTPASTTSRTVTLTDGLFTEDLGDTSLASPYAAIADTVFGDNTAVYLEVEVEGEVLTPRKRVTAVAYALNAQTLDGVDLATIQLWETGAGRTFEDDQPVVVGADAAFTYGSGGVGDLRVADEIEVLGDGFIDNDLVVGASTSATETITDTDFTLGGDDGFVAGTFAVEGSIYTDADLVLETGSVIDFNDGDITVTHGANLLTFAGGTIALGTATATRINSATTGSGLLLQDQTLTSAVGDAVEYSPTWSTGDSAHRGIFLDITQDGSNAFSLTGMTIALTQSGAGTVTNNSGLVIATPVAAGTMTTVTGVDINNQSLAGSTNASALRISSQNANATNTRAIEIQGTGLNNAVELGDLVMYSDASNSLRVMDATNARGFDVDLTAAGNQTLGTTAGNFEIGVAGASELTLTSTALSPTTSDGNALGTSSLMWGDLFLASGGVVNFNAGDVTMTHAANILAIEGGNVGIGDSTPSAQLEVGNGTDSLQVSTVGDLTFVDADGGASITGPAGGTFALSSGASQIMSVVGSGGLSLSATSTGVFIDATVTPANGASGFLETFNTNGGTITEGTAGNHDLLAGTRFVPPTITAGAATVTDAATVYISNETSATVSGANYALLVDDGRVKFDRTLEVGDGNTGDAYQLNVAGSLGPDPNQVVGLASIGGTITEASSGTHAILSSLYVEQPTVNVGAATVTNAATIYVEGAPSATVTGGNYALLVDAGDTVFDANAVVGGSTSRTETIADAAFSLGGDDLFVAGSLGVEGNSYFDGTVSFNDITCTDCLDFDSFENALDLDEATEIQLGTLAFSFDLDSTGDITFEDADTPFLTLSDTDVFTYVTDLTTTDAVTFTGNSLTTGDLMQLSATNTGAGDVLQITGGTTTGTDNFAIHVTAGDVFAADDVLIGATAETLSNGGFVQDGDDLFVAGMAGIEGNVHTDAAFIAGASTSYGNGAIVQSSGETLTMTTTSAELLMRSVTSGNVRLEAATDLNLYALAGQANIYGAFTVPSGQSANLVELNVGAGAFTEAGVGNHPLLAGLHVGAPSVTGGVATVSDTASLYIADAMSATVSGTNYALFVDSGTSRFDGAVVFGGNLDMQNNLILNIGDAGTDFLTGGGLTLADILTVNDDLTVALTGDENVEITDGATPTVDVVSIVANGASVTADANALEIDFTTGDGASVTQSGIQVDLASGGTASGDIIYGLNLTMDAADASTQTAINIGANFDTAIGMASGGVVSWNGGDVTMTHSANTLAFAGASTAYTFDDEVEINQTAPGEALDINVTTTAYTNGVGAVDVVRTGSFTGVAAETLYDLRLAPTSTITEPAAGTFTYRQSSFDTSGLTVTGAAGDSTVTSLYLADDGGATNNFLLHGLASASGRIYIDATSTVHTDTNGVISVEMRSGTAETVAYEGILTQTADVSDISVFSAFVQTGGFLDTVTNSTAGYVSTLIDNAGDAGGLLAGYFASAVSDAGAATKVGYFVTSANLDYTLASNGAMAIGTMGSGGSMTLSTTGAGTSITMTPVTDTIFSNNTGVIIGHTSQIATSITPEVQVLGTGGADSALVLGRWGANANDPAVQFVKSRNATIGSSTIVQDNDLLGSLYWYPDDGTDFANVSAGFLAEVDDASPAANDVGTAFVWQSQPGGAGVLEEQMRLSATGNLIPGSNDNGSLGVSDIAWADLFLASGGVINWAGDVTLTHASNALTFAGLEDTTITQAVATSGTPNLLTLTGAAHTTLTASTEVTDVDINLGQTKQWATGANATQRAINITAPTYSAVAASTFGSTLAATVAIDSAPHAGTNVDFSNAYGLTINGFGQNTTNGFNQGALLVNPIGLANGVLGNSLVSGIQIGNDSTVNMSDQTATTTTFAGLFIDAIGLQSFTNTRTITNPASLYIEGAPSSSGNITFTNGPYALFVDAGNARFDANAIVGGSTSSTETIDHASFSLGGDDLFVAGSLGAEGNSYFDGAVDITYTDRGLFVTNTTGGADIPVATFQSDSASPAASDKAYLSLQLSDSVGTQTEFARLAWDSVDVTNGSEDGRIDFGVITAGTYAEELFLNGATFGPSGNDGVGLGNSASGFSDLFLASGGVINWLDAGPAVDVTMTHSANALAFAGASTGYSFDSNVYVGGGSADTDSTVIAHRNFTASAGSTANQILVAGNITENTSGTHSVLAGIEVNTFTVVDGGGTEVVTNLAGVYIEGAPTAGTTPTNGPYALFVDSGASRFDGAVTLGGNLDMQNNLILNIGDAGTDFLAGGGLTLADILTVNDDLTVALTGDENIEVTDGATPTVDVVSVIANGATVTDDANALEIDFTTGDGAGVTNSALKLDLASGGTAGTDIVQAIGITMDAADASTQVGIGFVDNNFDLDITANTDLTLGISGTSEAILNATNFYPTTDDGSALGVSGTAWADLFLASGGDINWNAGAVILRNLGSDALNLLGSNLYIQDGFGLSIGTDSVQLTTSSQNEFQVLGTAGADSSGTFARFSADGNGPQVHFVKSRNASIGSNTIVQDNDVLGAVQAFADDGADFANRVASFEMEVDDASPAANDIGGAFVWYSLPGGTGAFREVMRVPAAGGLLPGTNDLGALGASGTAWSDLFLASGSVVDFNAGDVTVTHAANQVAVQGGNVLIGATSVSGVHASFVPDGDDVFLTGDIGIQDTAYADAFVAGDSSTTYGNGTITSTGTFAINTGSTITIGDGGDAIVMDAAGWDVSTTGAVSGLDSIASDDNQTTLAVNIPVTGADAGAHTLSLQIDSNTAISVTATGNGAGSVGVPTTTLAVAGVTDIINIGDVASDIAITDVEWSVTAAGAATFTSQTLNGNLDMTNDLILNIGDANTDFVAGGGLTLAGTLTSNGASAFNGDNTFTLGSGEDIAISSTPAANATTNPFNLSLTTPATGVGQTTVNNALDLALTIGNATGGTATARAINIGNITGDAEVATLNAVSIGTLTGTGSTGEIAVTIGAGWDADINATTSLELAIGGTNEVTLDGTALSPSAGGGLALGTATLDYANLFINTDGVINFENGDVTITHSANDLAFAGVTGDYSFDDSVVPASDGGGSLGASGTEWSNLFLNTAGVINFQAGDVTVTHSANTLAFGGASTAYTFDDEVEINKTGTDTASAIDINVSSTAYTTAVGAVDIDRTGNITGVAGEEFYDLSIVPSFTLIEPGSSSISYIGAMIDMDSVLVTDNALGDSTVAALALYASGDTDVGNDLALMAGTGSVQIGEPGLAGGYELFSSDASALSIVMPGITNNIGATSSLSALSITNDAGSNVVLGNQTATTTSLSALNIDSITYDSTTLVRTVTNASSLSIAGPPVAGTNVTFTNTATSLSVLTGTSALLGTVILGDNGDAVAIDSNDWDINSSGTITGVAFNANGTGNSLSNVDGADLTNDTLDFSEFQDTLDVDAATDLNLGTNLFSIDLDSTGDFQIRDVTTAIATFADSGAITFAPTSGTDFTVTLGGAASDDFLVDTDVLVAESDTNRVGIGTASPLTSVLTGAGTISGEGLHIVDGASFGNLVVEGAGQANLILGDTSAAANDKGLLFFVDNGVSEFQSLNDDLTTRIDNIFLMDLGSGQVSVGGNGATATLATGAGDLFVTNEFEVDGAARFDSTIDHTHTSNTDAYNLVANTVSTTDVMQITANGLTTGRGLYITSTSPSLTTADITEFEHVATYTASTTVSSGNVLDVTRTLTINGGGQTLTVQSPVAYFGDDCDVTAGTCTTSADVIQIEQIEATNSGAALNIDYGGGSSGFALRVNDDGTFTDSTPFVVDYQGNVGVSTTTPAADMEIVDTANGGVAELQLNASHATDGNAGVTFATVGTERYSIGYDRSATTFRIVTGATLDADTDDGVINLGGDVTLDLNGTVTTNGLCHSNAATDAATTDRAIVVCNGTPADVAEWYETTPGVEPAEIVATTTTVLTYTASKINALTGETIGDETLRTAVLTESSETYQSNMIGVVSTSPAKVYGRGVIASASHPQPIAITGRVPLKVSDENGVIVPGDLITSSSIPGVGMKATKPGMTIGYALDGWSGSGQGVVMLYIQPAWHAAGTIASNGTIGTFNSDFAFTSTGAADAADQGDDSYALSFRGSGWDGAAAQNVAMTLENVVTNANDYRLSIKNTNDTEVAYITDEGLMKVAGDLVLGGKLYPSDRGVPQTDKYIFYDSTGSPTLDYMRTNAAGWATGSYDFAEMFPASEPLAAGDVVVFGSDNLHLKKSQTSYQPTLAGIVSTRPGFLAGDFGPNTYPIALAGRVPTKVTAENGTIEIGDPLTSSATRPGYAMKATDAGPVIGYALEPYRGSDNDKIVVFVNLSYHNPKVEQPTNALPGTNNVASGFTGSGASSLDLYGNLYMHGGNIIDAGRIVGLANAWSIEADGTFITDKTFDTRITSYQGEKVQTHALTGPDVLVTLFGTAELNSGLATIEFEKISPQFNDVISTMAPIRVVVTPNGPVSVYVSDKTMNGFAIKQIGGADTGISVDWMASAYRKDYEPKVELILPAAEEPVITEEPIVVESAPTAPVVVVESAPTIEPITEPMITEAPAVAEPIVEVTPVVVEPAVSEPVVETAPVVEEPAVNTTTPEEPVAADAPAPPVSSGV